MSDRESHALGDQLAEHHIWMERVRMGDRGAFELLFREYYPVLVPFLYRFTKSKETSEELVQELFLSIWTNHATIVVTRNVRAYLFHAAQNRALSYLRRHRLELQWQVDATYTNESQQPDADLDVAQMELVLALQQAIAELPERGREVFLLSRRSHLSHAEIAARLNISVKTVEVHMGRALRKLRDRLKHFVKI